MIDTLTNTEDLAPLQKELDSAVKGGWLAWMYCMRHEMDGMLEAMEYQCSVSLFPLVARLVFVRDLEAYVHY